MDRGTGRSVRYCLAISSGASWAAAFLALDQPERPGAAPSPAGWARALGLALVLWLAGCAGWGVMIAGPLLAVAGQFGDIAESWLKRQVGVQDSSDLIPGAWRGS